MAIFITVHCGYYNLHLSRRSRGGIWSLFSNGILVKDRQAGFTANRQISTAYTQNLKNTWTLLSCSSTHALNRSSRSFCVIHLTNHHKSVNLLELIIHLLRFSKNLFYRDSEFRPYKRYQSPDLMRPWVREISLDQILTTSCFAHWMALMRVKYPWSCETQCRVSSSPFNQ